LSKILLTGGTGFIGSDLLPRLRSAGHDVYLIIRYVSGGRYNFYDREKTVIADLRDGDAVRKAVLDVKPEVIIHLAAQTAVSYSFINPSDVFHTNTIGTVNLAAAALECNTIKQFIHASSSEVYGIQTDFPIKETAQPNPTSPYAVSKIACEGYLHLLEKMYGFPVTIMRPFNTFGRAIVKNRHYVVERAFTGAIEDGVISLHNGSPIREFVFREDHALAYMCALGNEKAIGETFNICYGTAHTIKGMVNVVADVVGGRLGKKIEVNFKGTPDRPLDIPNLTGDPTKTKTVLGWQPQYNLRSGIEKAVDEWIEALRNTRTTWSGSTHQ
jgi:nucleoside-diphosphate-sugar epimerase